MSGFLSVIPRLEKLLPLLGSDRDGEVIAAVGAIRRALTAAGSDFHDLSRSVTAGARLQEGWEGSVPMDIFRREQLLRVKIEEDMARLRQEADALRGECAALRAMKAVHPLTRTWIEVNTHTEAAAQVLAYSELLTRWEMKFCAEIMLSTTLSDKQRPILERCWRKARAFAHARCDFRDLRDVSTEVAGD